MVKRGRRVTLDVVGVVREKSKATAPLRVFFLIFSHLAFSHFPIFLFQYLHLPLGGVLNYVRAYVHACLLASLRACPCRTKLSP